MKVKNIIFDLGVVVLNIDYKGPAKVLERMGNHNFEEYYSKAQQNSLFDDFEKGLISPDDFRLSFKEHMGLPLNNDIIDSIWNSIILDFPQQRIDLLIALKKNYQTFLLSNTNKIHCDFYTNQLNKDNGLDWKDLFHKTFFSHEMGLRKPDPEIYMKALNGAQIKAEESLFIDDLLINIEAAKTCGLQTIWLQEGMELKDIFEKDVNTEAVKIKAELLL